METKVPGAKYTFVETTIKKNIINVELYMRCILDFLLPAGRRITGIQKHWAHALRLETREHHVREAAVSQGQDC